MGRRRFTPTAKIVPQVPWQVTQKVRELPRKAAQLVEAAMQITASQHPLAWITQWGARLMLQVALEEEVVAFLHGTGMNADREVPRGAMEASPGP